MWHSLFLAAVVDDEDVDGDDAMDVEGDDAMEDVSKEKVDSQEQREGPAHRANPKEQPPTASKVGLTLGPPPPHQQALH